MKIGYKNKKKNRRKVIVHFISINRPYRKNRNVIKEIILSLLISEPLIAITPLSTFQSCRETQQVSTIFVDDFSATKEAVLVKIPLSIKS